MFNQTICTKAIAFRLVQYEKLILLDADCIVQINCDDLFTKTTAPAATFMNMYSKEPDAYGKNLKHNDAIHTSTIHKQLTTFRGFVGSGKMSMNATEDSSTHNASFTRHNLCC
jgi:alpha-N-acetylglucosamine transferase